MNPGGVGKLQFIQQFSFSVTNRVLDTDSNSCHENHTAVFEQKILYLVAQNHNSCVGQYMTAENFQYYLS